MVLEDAHADFGTFVRNRLGVSATQRVTRQFIAPRTLVLHAMVSSAGHEQITDPAYDWHGRKRGTADFALIQITLAGRGQLEHAGERYVLTPGQAMVLRFPDDNRYWLAPGDVWEHCYVCVHGREVLRAWHAAVEKLGPILPLTTRHPVLAATLDLIALVLGSSAPDPYTASARSYAVAMALLAAVPDAPTAAAAHPGIAEAQAWARAHATQALSVGDLARIAGLSRFHFSRLFRRHVGSAPTEWLTDLRLRQATRLLRDRDLSIAAIAHRCGYADAAYFCRAFRRTFGVSPGEFRASGMY